MAVQNTRNLERLDVIDPIETWPKWAQENFHALHKSNNQRFNLWLFLWRNGVEPQLAQDIVFFHHRFGGEFRYDTNAWTDIGELVKVARQSLSEKKRKLEMKPMYILAAKRVLPDSSGASSAGYMPDGPQVPQYTPLYDNGRQWEWNEAKQAEAKKVALEREAAESAAWKEMKSQARKKSKYNIWKANNE